MAGAAVDGSQLDPQAGSSGEFLEPLSLPPLTHILQQHQTYYYFAKECLCLRTKYSTYQTLAKLLIQTTTAPVTEGNTGLTVSNIQGTWMQEKVETFLSERAQNERFHQLRPGRLGRPRPVHEKWFPPDVMFQIV